jgi:hypothetical protein
MADPRKAGAPDTFPLTVGEVTIHVPIFALKDGAHAVFLSEGVYMEIEEYALSVEQFLSALKGAGISKIQF